MAYVHVKTLSEIANDNPTLGRWQAQLHDQLAAAQTHCTRYIAQEPVRSTLIAVAGGALLTGLLLATLRGSHRGRG
jgi:hypothetical protein